MYCNGILISSQSPAPHFDPEAIYRGVAYGVPWPLFNATDRDPADDEFIHEIDRILMPGFLDDGTFPPFVLSQMELVNRYVARCRSYGLDTRLLLCSTPKPWPVMEDETARELHLNARCLGYDYAYSSCSYSALYDDLSNPPSPELRACSEKLNASGLFDTQDYLDTYVTARWDFVRTQGEDFIEVDGRRVRRTTLEDNGYFVPYLVHELAGS